MPHKRYFWDSVSDSVMQELDDAYQPVVTYTREPSLYGPLVSEQRGVQFRQYHFDALGSARTLTDENGDVTDTFAYDAWGNEVSRTGITPTPFAWVGQWGYNSSSLLYTHVRARLLTASIGRWLSTDPAIEDINLYRYYKNSPGRHIDPSGTLTIEFSESGGEDICGQVDQRFAKWVFWLDRPAPCDGYFVQHIKVNCLVKDCLNCSDSSPVTPDLEVWEAFYVKKGERTNVQVLFGIPNGTTDSFSMPGNWNNTCGQISGCANVRFYCQWDLNNQFGAETGFLDGFITDMAYWLRGDERCSVTFGLHSPTEPDFWKSLLSKVAPRIMLHGIGGVVARQMTFLFLCIIHSP